MCVSTAQILGTRLRRSGDVRRIFVCESAHERIFCNIPLTTARGKEIILAFSRQSPGPLSRERSGGSTVREPEPLFDGCLRPAARRFVSRACHAREVGVRALAFGRPQLGEIDQALCELFFSKLSVGRSLVFFYTKSGHP